MGASIGVVAGPIGALLALCLLGWWLGFCSDKGLHPDKAKSSAVSMDQSSVSQLSYKRESQDDMSPHLDSSRKQYSPFGTAYQGPAYAQSAAFSAHDEQQASNQLLQPAEQEAVTAFKANLIPISQAQDMMMKAAMVSLKSPSW
jgi:hypothetical protein